MEHKASEDVTCVLGGDFNITIDDVDVAMRKIASAPS